MQKSAVEKMEAVTSAALENTRLAVERERAEVQKSAVEKLEAVKSVGGTQFRGRC